MKISIHSVWGALIFLTCIGVSHFVSMDYRYKIRGPPQPPRQPPPPQFINKWENKKWEQNRPSRISNRPRPIPMKISSEYMSKPAGVPQRPTPVPVRNYWKNTKAPFQTVVKDKPFQSSPPITNTHEFDFHIQTNYIPNTHSIPIKQVGEKGPIHTIPAPNLSLADKPIMVDSKPTKQKQNLINKQQIKQIHHYPQLMNHPQQSGPIRQFQTLSHQYQVTEANEQKLLRDQQQQNYYANGVFPTVQANYGNVDPVLNLQGHLATKDLYQILNTHMQQQPQIFDSYDVSLLPQPLVQPQPVMSTQSLYQPESAYSNQIQYLARHSSPKDLPDFQAFNPEQTIHGSVISDDQSAFITTDYNLKTNSSVSVQEPQHAAVSSPYIQEIFQDNSNNKDDHSVKVSDGNEEQVFYTTLPNRQAAESLASLQAAGNLNNNLNNLVRFSHKSPLEIYVPDQQERGVGDGDTQEYVDVAINVENLEKDFPASNNSSKYQTHSFGNRIRPKQI